METVLFFNVALTFDAKDKGNLLDFLQRNAQRNGSGGTGEIDMGAASSAIDAKESALSPV